MALAVGIVADSYNASAFDPTDITGLAAWFDASDAASITSSGGAVSQWNDKSGAGRHVTQTTAGNKPTTASTTLNGLNVIVFDGTADRLDSAATQLINGTTGEWTSFVVCRPTTGTGVRVVFDHDLGSSTLDKRQATFLKLSNTTTQCSALNTTPAIFTDSGAAFTASTANIFCAVRGATTIEMFLNGTSGASTATTGTPNATTPTIGFRFGGNDAVTPTQFFQGDLAEIVVYNTALSSGDRTSVHNYLKAKWGTP